MQRFPNVKWDFIIIDEAHNLRNVFHGTKRAKRLYELSKGIPKILLTATPLQNSLTDLHGLISFIDPRIFGSEKVFNKRFIEGQDYTELKRDLIPVLYRTLRRDVGKYMDFKKRECRTIDFVLSPDEVELYMRVNNFLKRDVLYSIPNANKGLIVLVIRKLLASSSYALIETFEVLKNRLQKLYEGTKSANAQDGFDLFWDFVEDEIDESGFEEVDDEDTLFQKQQIQAEMDEVDAIIDTASRIKSNAKIKALKTAIHTAFDYQGKQGIPQKVVVFTESKRTQKYIASELRKDGFDEDDILLFNGDFNDAMTKEIYRAWQVKNFGKTNYGRIRFDKPFTDKANIKKYLFTGYKKAYYTENAFDSDTERLFSIILEEDPDVIRWIKPPLNQLGLFWQAGQQYNPDFLVETTNSKFMVEVKAANEVTADDVVAKAREGIKWCHFASEADPDHKVWEYRLISDDNIKLGNTCKYTLGTAHKIKEG